jgi:biopolymer transport protein ExbB/TolQ
MKLFINQLNSNIMTNLFYEGGPLFMGILTLILLVILIMGVTNGVAVSKNSSEDNDGLMRRLSRIKSVGLFALVFGILGQLIGLYSAFVQIQAMGNVSPAILAGGIKVSMITTIYGVIIFLIAYLIWFGLVALVERKVHSGS